MVGFGADSHMGQLMRQNLDGIGHPEPGIHGNEDSPVIPKFCEAISLSPSSSGGISGSSSALHSLPGYRFLNACQTNENGSFTNGFSIFYHASS